MIRRSTVLILSGITCLLLSGCLYRGDGSFKRMGDSDYKVRLNIFNLFVAADGRPTYVGGTVLLEDHMTPLKNTRIILKTKGKETPVSNSYTDHVGRFNMSAILVDDFYDVEIDSAEYIGNKEIKVEHNRENWHEVIAHKR